MSKNVAGASRQWRHALLLGAVSQHHFEGTELEQTTPQGRGHFGVGSPALQPTLKMFMDGKGEEGRSRSQTVQPFPPPPTQPGAGADPQPVS